MDSPTCDNRPHRCPALTLVEVLIVAVVLSIAALLAAPMVAQTDQTRLQAAARLLIADVAFAQNESITHPDDPYAIKVDSVTASYSVVHDTGYPPFGCASATVVTDPITSQPYTTVFGGTGRGSQLAGVTIQTGAVLGGDDCVLFGQFGETDQSTPASVTLVAGGKTLTLSIDPISGEATTP